MYSGREALKIISIIFIFVYLICSVGLLYAVYQVNMCSIELFYTLHIWCSLPVFVHYHYQVFTPCVCSLHVFVVCQEHKKLSTPWEICLLFVWSTRNCSRAR